MSPFFALGQVTLPLFYKFSFPGLPAHSDHRPRRRVLKNPPLLALPSPEETELHQDPAGAIQDLRHPPARVSDAVTY